MGELGARGAMHTPLTVVLTGGPGGGKSSVQQAVADALRRHGMHVLAVPEAARLVLAAGWPTGAAAPTPPLAFQRAVLKLQVALRLEFTQLAGELGGPVAIVFDRAEPDGAAYLPPGMYDALLEEVGHSLATAARQYDMVVHLRSAATGLAGAYVLDEDRQEPPDRARALDAAVEQAWSAHPARLVVAATERLEEKIDRVIQVVDRLSGRRR